MNKISLRLLMGFAVLSLVGCMDSAPKRDPAFAAVRPVSAPVPERHDGAIFNVRTNLSLFEDYKARRVGDILTVRLEERMDAEKESDTSVNKSSNANIQNPVLFGAQPQFGLPGMLPLNNTSNNNLAFELNANRNFSGSGESEQSNFLRGNVSVSVVEVLANGNLVVQGEKVITINRGHEYIRLSGIVSPRDIDSTNTVPSIRVADAHVSYTGDGAVNDATVMGWISRFFTSALMPF